MTTSTDNLGSATGGQVDPDCGMTGHGIVVPPREVFLLVTGSAIAGLFLLAFSILLFKRLDRS